MSIDERRTHKQNTCALLGWQSSPTTSGKAGGFCRCTLSVRVLGDELAFRFGGTETKDLSLRAVLDYEQRVMDCPAQAGSGCL